MNGTDTLMEYTHCELLDFTIPQEIPIIKDSLSDADSPQAFQNYNEPKENDSTEASPATSNL